MAGACRTWVDDELDAMGEAGAHIPRPSGCCEKDMQKQREAAAMLRELSEVDASTARMKLVAGVVGDAEAAADGSDDD